MNAVMSLSSRNNGGKEQEEMSTIYEPLVISPPPANARKDFLSLWHRVIAKRTDQLQKMDVKALNTLYLSHRADEDSMSAEKWKVLKSKFPLGNPTDKNHFIDLFRYLLTNNFHFSVDSTKNADHRLKALEILKKIFSEIDLAYAKQMFSDPKNSSTPAPASTSSAITRETDDQTSSAATVAAVVTTTVSAAKTSDRTEGRVTASNDDVAAENMTSTEKKNDGRKNPNMVTSTPVTATNTTAESNTINKNKSSFTTSNKTKISATATKNPSLPCEIIEIGSDDDTDDDPMDDDDVNDQNKITVNKLSNNQSTEATTNRSVTATRAIEDKKVEVPAPAIPKRIPRANKPLSNPPRFLQCTINFGLDSGTPIPSCSLQTRSHCQLTVHHGEENPPSIISTTLNGEGLDDMYQRFEKWEPYWKVVHDCSLVMKRDQAGKCYETGYKTAPVLRHTCHLGEAPVSAMRIPFQVDFLHTTNTLRSASESFVNGSNSRGMDGKAITWGQIFHGRTYSHGQRRLILRALPLKFSDYYKKKKADTHCWPKGTFFQLSGAIHHISQRKQQSHDIKLWKGLCYMYDLTPIVTNPAGRYNIDICTRDKDSYVFQVAICDFLSPEYLFEKCMSPPNVVGSIRKLSYQDGLDIAMKYVNKSAVVLDYSDDDDENTASVKEADVGNVTLTFNMKCPMSMTPIEEPVRGRNCKHMQCFDLRNFLQTNVAVSGGRWRCAICEDFVAVDDLIYDGFQKNILKTYEGQISTIRDKVQFFADGTYKLMEENKLRYNNKKKRGNNSSNEANKRVKLDSGKKIPAEVIEL